MAHIFYVLMLRYPARLVLTAFALACAPAAPQADDSANESADTASLPIKTHTETGPGLSPWDDARRRGIEFRAIGQEPGWMLEIDHEKSLYLLADYGAKKVTMPSPKPTRDSSGTITYDGVTEAHRLTVMLRELVCHDSMSGEEMTHTVTVTLDRVEYRGCGRRLGL